MEKLEKGRENRYINRGILILAAVVMTVFVMMLKTEKVSAASELYFEESKYSLYVGNTRTTCLNFDDEADVANQPDFWWYGGYFESSDKSVVLVDGTGRITCVGAGTATVTGHYLSMTATVKVKVKENKFTLSEDNIVIYQGESAEVKLTGPRKAYSYDYSLIDKESLENAYGGIECENDGKGTFTITGEEPGKYYTDLIINARNGESYSKRCSVEVLQCGLVDSGMAVALGKKGKLYLKNAEFVSADLRYCYNTEGEWLDASPVTINEKTVRFRAIWSADVIIPST